MESRSTSAALAVALGLAGVAGAWLLLASGADWARVWFYDLAWYPWLFTLDGLARLGGRESLLFNRPARLISWWLWSVPVWLIFEAFNFRLDNWHYQHLPLSLSVRWLGYAIAFATVLPALFLTRRALAAWGLPHRVRVRPLAPGRWWYGSSTVLGLILAALPLIWPRYFFPLVWLAGVFILEPVNHARGGRSLAADWQAGRATEVVRLLIAGFICGGIWEFLNYWAGARWFYTVPFVNGWKIFEMPVLGFFGFPPFALECWCLHSFLERTFRRRRVTASAVSPTLRFGAVGLIIVFCGLVMAGIDAWTVVP